MARLKKKCKKWRNREVDEEGTSDDQWKIVQGDSEEEWLHAGENSAWQRPSLENSES